ncbi:hypothetical protein TWF281_005115 [Arthrobotrys megalospora]
MTLHHRPSIDVPLSWRYTSRRERKRPGRAVGDENVVVNGGVGGSMAGGRRPVQQPTTPSRSNSVGGSATTPVRRGNGPGAGMWTPTRVINGNGSSAPGTPTRMGNGNGPMISRSPGNGVPHGSRIPSTAGKSTPSGPINRTPTKPGHHINSPKTSPIIILPPVKPLLTASQRAAAALSSIGVKKRPLPPQPPARPKPGPITIPQTPPPQVPKPLTIIPPPPRPPPPPPPNYTLQVSVDLTLRTIVSEVHTSMPPIIEGIWVNVIGYKRIDGVIDAISIFKIKGKLNLEAYEKAIVGMSRVRETVEWEVKEGIAKGIGLQGGVWD